MSPTPGWVYGPLDPIDQWLGEDKLAHFGWAAAVFALGWAYGGNVRGWVGVLAGALLVEAVEVVRYQAWAKGGFPQPWPFLTDKVSPKDLLVAVIAAMLMMWLLPHVRY